MGVRIANSKSIISNFVVCTSTQNWSARNTSFNYYEEALECSALMKNEIIVSSPSPGYNYRGDVCKVFGYKRNK